MSCFFFGNRSSWQNINIIPILFLSRNSVLFVAIVTSCVNERLKFLYDKIIGSLGHFTPKQRYKTEKTRLLLLGKIILWKFEVRNFHFTNSAWNCQVNSACKHISLSLQSLQTQSVKTTLYFSLYEKRLVKFSIWIIILHAKAKTLEYQQYSYIAKIISAKVINFGSNTLQSNSNAFSWRVEIYFEVKVSSKIRIGPF